MEPPASPTITAEPPPPAANRRPTPAATLLKGLLVISLPLYVLDQVTKYAVVRNIRYGEYIPVVPGWFDLVHVHNTGAAWGMMHDSNTFFVVLSLVALVVMAVLYLRNAFADALQRTGFFLLASGIFGNVTDRLVHGHVVDFLSFDLHVPGANPWPSFNVADSCICMAVGLFLIRSFLDLFPKDANPPR